MEPASLNSNQPEVSAGNERNKRNMQSANIKKKTASKHTFFACYRCFVGHRPRSSLRCSRSGVCVDVVVFWFFGHFLIGFRSDFAVFCHEIDAVFAFVGERKRAQRERSFNHYNTMERKQIILIRWVFIGSRSISVSVPFLS